MGKKDPRVDEYIARSAPFARPILKHLRKVVHAGCPDVVETIKWGSPSFEHHGILAGMAAFTKHCVFGAWKHELLTKELGAASKPDEAMGHLGRITSLSDLPSEKVLVRYVRRAAELNEQGVKVPRKAPPASRKLAVPPDLTAALRRNKRALATFEAFSPSHRREYVEWVTEAKREETRKRRLEQAIAWMAEGKVRNWKYVAR